MSHVIEDDCEWEEDPNCGTFLPVRGTRNLGGLPY
jgi:hypothetical protein